MTRHISLGRWGERFAADYLAQAGYTVTEHNYRTPHGEIDLVAQKGGELVFVEVKTRTSSSLGPPEISISKRKQAHLLASVAYYIQQNSNPPLTWRIDVIAIQRFGMDQPPLITHFENAIS